MPRKRLPQRAKIGVMALSLALLAAGGIYWRIPLWEHAVRLFAFFSDRSQVSLFINHFGPAAPLVFVVAQVLQVMLAPIPGEATGFIGGYLFGTTAGFVYSTIGLTIGSWLNFCAGRFLGKKLINRVVSPARLARFDALVNGRGAFLVFLLFVFPGFPKDLLCLVLGVSAMPLFPFVWIVLVGRMPGTLMLSLQGEFLFERMYLPLAVMTALCLAAAAFSMLCRRRIYAPAAAREIPPPQRQAD